MGKTAGMAAALIIATISFSAFSQERAEIYLTNPFGDLIELVANDSTSIPQEIPEDIADSVCDFYSDYLVSDSTSMEVLDYLAGIYDLHGYHEAGSWFTMPNRIKTTPYIGTLPEYELSDFQPPVNGTITSRFGFRNRFGRFHYGLDISLHSGDTVKCVLPGVVTKTGYDYKGYGSYIVVAHGRDMETLYAHLQRSLVLPGETIEVGQPIGIGGSTGNATGSHLHFETRYMGHPVDPLSLFSKLSRPLSF